MLNSIESQLQPIDIEQDVACLLSNDVKVEQRITFYIHFPEGYQIQVETLPNKLAHLVIKKIINHFGMAMSDIEMVSSGSFFSALIRFLVQ